jgi:hypothetical protein
MTCFLSDVRVENRAWGASLRDEIFALIGGVAPTRQMKERKEGLNRDAHDGFFFFFFNVYRLERVWAGYHVCLGWVHGLSS